MIFTVAIDGPAAAGKGTISKSVAAHFGFAYLDTGLLYRAVGAKVLNGSDPLEAANALSSGDLNADNLRTHLVAQSASEIAVIPQVRAALLTFQRDFARRDGGAVLDGRDIGTVICPQAEAKVFVTASAECRADRRFKELADRGNDITFDQVLADVIARDKRDAERAEAPMIAAADASLLDTSNLSIDAAIAQAIALVQEKLR